MTDTPTSKVEALRERAYFLLGEAARAEQYGLTPQAAALDKMMQAFATFLEELPGLPQKISAEDALFSYGWLDEEYKAQNAAVDQCQAALHQVVTALRRGE